MEEDSGDTGAYQDNPSLPARFARQVRRLREARGWNQADLVRRLAAAGTPLGRSRVSGIEASGRSVTLEQVEAFAQIFGVPAVAMVADDVDMNRGLLDYIEWEQRQVAAQRAVRQAIEALGHALMGEGPEGP